MKFTTVIVLNIAAIGGYLTARTLLQDDTELDRLPSAARNPSRPGGAACSALARGCGPHSPRAASNATP